MMGMVLLLLLLHVARGLLQMSTGLFEAVCQRRWLRLLMLFWRISGVVGRQDGECSAGLERHVLSGATSA